MMKKKILIILTVLVVITVGVYFILSNKSKYPKSTGGKYEAPSAEEITLGNAINSLQKQLPYTNGVFIITKFDYKTARFEVDLNGINQEEFFNWLSTTPFYPIPSKRFKLQIN